MISLARLTESAGIKAELFAKLEGQNPAGSAKDRVALYMLDTAEKQRKLKPGGTIVEPTSGNTGIGLCAVAAARGYKVIITMPETMSVERQKLMKAYGAELVLTEGAKGMAGAIAKAEEISAQTGAMLAGQFVNPANPEAHYRTTGPEIWRDAGGKVDAFVAGVGTGVFGSVRDVRALVCRPGSADVPNTARSAEYDRYYALFRALYPHLQGDFKTLSGL